jgi:23S rRNA pseudouridine1911/1915/1917 synthase
MVSINGVKESNCGKKLKSNDEIVLTFEDIPISLTPFDYNLDIIYEDEYLVVLDKPANLTVHPGVKENHKTLANALVARFPNLSTVSGSFRPGIVHRLDKDTSGLIIIAKDNDVHIKLKGQIIERNVKRSYLAITYGVPLPKIGQIITKIAPMKNDPTKMHITNDINAKLAVTDYRVIDSFENQQFSLVECNLGTGRTHQIRVHMHYKNSPIIGDKKYAGYYNFNADAVSNSQLADKIKNIDRHALHACKIEFTHPITEKQISCEAPLEKSLAHILHLMKKDVF